MTESELHGCGLWERPKKMRVWPVSANGWSSDGVMMRSSRKEGAVSVVGGV